MQRMLSQQQQQSTRMALYRAIDNGNEHETNNILSVFYAHNIPEEQTEEEEATAAAAVNDLPLISAENDIDDTDRPGANVGLDINSKANGLTPLFMAVSRDNVHSGIVRLLLAHGASPSTLCTHTRSPLFVCVLRWHTEAAALLLSSARCDPDLLCTRQRVTALHVAVGEGRLDLIDTLLTHGASPNALSPEFGTPLHVAAARNHCNCARLLLAANANVNALTADGDTPLIVAARKGRVEFVQLLLNQPQIDVYAKDSVVGHTALHEAALNSHHDVARALLRRFPKLACVRSTLTRQTATFAASFKANAVMIDGYSATRPGFARPAEVVGATSDIALVAESAESDGIACHRVVLFARCAALAKLYADQGEPAQRLVVPATICAAKALPFVVEYLYSDFVEQLADRGDKLLSQIATAATRLRLPRLNELCAAASAQGARFNTVDAASFASATPSSFAADMAPMVFNEQFSDVRLSTGEDSVAVPAHKFVLAQASSYFRALLCGPMRESRQDVVQVPLHGDNTELALRVTLAFLYTHKLEMPTGDTSHLVLDLFEIAHSLMLESLARRVESLLVADLIDVENVCQLYNLADMFHSLLLREECFDFIAENWASIDPAHIAALSAQTRAELDRLRAFRDEQRADGTSVRSSIAQLRLEHVRQRRAAGTSS
jgi:ankyrin repeat protein